MSSMPPTRAALAPAPARGYNRAMQQTPPSLVAFDDLRATIAAAGGDRKVGSRAPCDQIDRDGCMCPETLRLADPGLTC